MAGPSFQLEFLQYIQRLLVSGRFTSTYKFALLQALADLSVTHGDGTDNELTIHTNLLAERFLEMYRRQVLPYPGGKTEKILLQNSGHQAAVINCIMEEGQRYLEATKRVPEDTVVLGKIDDTIRRMPLGKLQNIGGEIVDFLYSQPVDLSVREIVLKPGISNCFRLFHPLITSIVQSVWLRSIRRLNKEILGDAADLHLFLFGPSRSSLEPYRKILMELQDGRCFYTNVRLGQDAEVDHFVPWSRYPVDLGHNFVLASPSANRSKSDFLASEKHLNRWIDRTLQYDRLLSESFIERGLPNNLRSSLRITKWSYSSANRAHELVWIKGYDREQLSGIWKSMLENAIRSVRRD